MDEFTAETFSELEKSAPVVAVSDANNDAEDDEGAGGGKSKSEEPVSKLRSAGSKIKTKFHDVIAGKNVATKNSLHDRIFIKLLEQIVPGEEIDEVLEQFDERSSRYTLRPSFSLPLMTNNFRRFNARIGIIFVFENRLFRLLSWKTPSHTLSLLAVSTFVCLDPYLLGLLPLASAILFIMVPAFLDRHPPPPPALNQATSGGPLPAPPRTLKPASEMSNDFFRNLRDLQNSMEDFSVIHDAVLEIFMPCLDFSNESMSSTIFLGTFISCCLLFISSHLLPWRYLFLVICWVTISLGHPAVQKLILTNREEHLKPHERTAKSWFEQWFSQDIILNAPPETREAEVFELQQQRGGDNGEWEAWMFSPSPHDPLSAQRIAEERPQGTRFFEDVAPPPGWDWADKKWILDLASREWVVERMIHGVEVEMEGERWVYDLSVKRSGNGEKTLNDVKRSAVAEVGRRDAEQDGDGSQTRGEWRRRRWVRSVRWKGLDDDVTAAQLQ